MCVRFAQVAAYHGGREPETPERGPLGGPASLCLG
jgi:hypothetical protein